MPQAEVKHTDGTTWFQSDLSRALRTIATAAASVFKIVADSSKQVLKPCTAPCWPVLVSNRVKALNFWTMARGQVCWAHLLAQIRVVCRARRPADAIGLKLLDYTGLVFEYSARLPRRQAQPRAYATDEYSRPKH